jgi:hypothetical protein
MKKVANGKLHNLYSSPNIIWHIKSSRMRWMHERGEKCVQGFGGKAKRKEATLKTEARIGAWAQNGS